MNQIKPPRWATQLLEWWADPNNLEEVQGDLLELYVYWVQTVGVKKANWRYAFSALKLLRPLAKRKKTNNYPRTYLFSPIMFSNYFKIAFRNLLKHKGYSFINIFGLATGMAVAMLIGLWVWDELSFNKSFKNYEKLGRVKMFQTFNGNRDAQDGISLPIGKELQKFSDIKRVSLASWNDEHIIVSGNNRFTKMGMYVEPQFTQMLSLQMVKGTQNGLKNVNVALISESLAKILFADTDPIGKLIKLDNKSNVSITGVYKDFHHNSDFRDIDILISWSHYLAEQEWVKNALTVWGYNSWQCFVQLNENTDFEKVSSKIKDIVFKHSNKEGKVAKPAVFIHPMSRWHLYSEFKEGRNTGGHIQFVWLFGIIGIFVLLLACINFMNLSTARSEKRAKEVGVRKAVGSIRTQLIAQFLSESAITVVLAFFISLILVGSSLSWFNDLAGKKMALPWTNLHFWIISSMFIVISGLLAGSYPALYLSSFEPLSILKGTFRVGRFASLPRKVLVVIQFTVSVTLIIGTSIVFKQIQFAKDRPIGYERNGLFYVMANTPELYKVNYETLRNELLATGVVDNMCKSNSPVTTIWSNSNGFDWEGKDPTTSPSFSTIAVSHDYVKTVGMQMKEGRDFSRAFSTDTATMIINEAAAKVLGFKNPIGQFIKWSTDNIQMQIIGVAKNMISESPYNPTRPAFFFVAPSWGNLYIIKLKNTINAGSGIEKIGTVFKEITPNSPFEYKFADEEYAKKFSQEQRIGTLATVFAIIAIFISCLGLFGLASFVAEQRTKEIGVRKVLGASVANLWQLLSKDFVVLVIISCLIAAPIAYYFMNEWLQKYTYRTEISWWVFIAAGVGALSITLLTVSFQAIKAALMNPVKSLRSE